MKILVTGAAGFIGFHLTQKLAKLNHSITAIDELNSYYDIELKKNRLKELGISVQNDANPVQSNKYDISFIKVATYKTALIESIFEKNKFDCVIHLAAQAGVRNSISNPYDYTKSNIDGFLPILEGCRNHKIKHLLYASSSSVYGNSGKVPFEETDTVDNPISLYAATKKANELMAHTYSHLYGIPTTGLRFFTVYGPWGRPDMAYYKFANAITNNEPIDIYNNGDLKRDFTFIDDIIEGIINLIPNSSTNIPPCEIFNIGNSKPVHLMEFISILESKLGKAAIKNYKDMQPGDVYVTYASTEKLEKHINYKPNTPLDKGLEEFAKWYNKYYNL